MKSFSWPIRVYYEDTDAGGVVYYANFLRFMERARTEWLRSYGIEQDQLRDEHGAIFVVRHVELNYLSPARLNDRLEVTAKVVAEGRTSWTFEQDVIRHDDGGSVKLCGGSVKIVCLDAAAFRPRQIPEHILMEIRSVC
ncbi:tol-pal system-associated acyl-CoA thioesterase [Pseudomonadota bacterium]